MTWTVIYHNEAVEVFVLGLPQGLLARYLRLTETMAEFGPNLGMPHTRAMGDGLFELRVKNKEGIARVFLLHNGTQPRCDAARLREEVTEDAPRELQLARSRLAEVRRT